MISVAISEGVVYSIHDFENSGQGCDIPDVVGPQYEQILMADCVKKKLDTMRQGTEANEGTSSTYVDLVVDNQEKTETVYQYPKVAGAVTYVTTKEVQYYEIY